MKTTFMECSNTKSNCSVAINGAMFFIYSGLIGSLCLHSGQHFSSPLRFVDLCIVIGNPHAVHGSAKGGCDTI